MKGVVMKVSTLVTSKITSLQEKVIAFSRGLGIGLGKNFTYIRKDLEFRIFTKADINIQFAIGLAEGLGYVSPYLSDELQS
jgi:hypothetical protein